MLGCINDNFHIFFELIFVAKFSLDPFGDQNHTL